GAQAPNTLDVVAGAVEMQRDRRSRWAGHRHAGEAQLVAPAPCRPRTERRAGGAVDRTARDASRAAQRAGTNGPRHPDAHAVAGRDAGRDLAAGLHRARRARRLERAVELDATFARARTDQGSRQGQRSVVVTDVAEAVAVDVGLVGVRRGAAVVRGIRHTVAIRVLERRQGRARGAAAVGRVACALTRRGHGAGAEAPAEIHLAEGRAVGRRASVQARIERGPAAVATRGGGAGTL